ncbi:MAG: NAD-dependent epimerase/dehydratase family protein [Gemmatimonadaceae bacterium]
MYVLVTGGTGVIGTAATRALLERGHRVRLLSRHAEHDSEVWAAGVDAFDGRVDDATGMRGAGDGCDAVLHIAGIIEEAPPETYESVNVGGTANALAEAARAGVGRFVYVSSLGAERGESGYHRSKHRAETLVRGFAGSWLIARPGNVYGPGDVVISRLLRMVRTLPAIPVVGGGAQAFQPIAADDLGDALAIAVERADLEGRAIELAGEETTSMNDLLDRFERITGKSPARVPLPAWLATAGASMAAAIGVGTPINRDQITMLAEENILAPDGPNELAATLGVTPTRLDAGLAALCQSIPEQLPSDGVGRLFRRRFRADIVGARHGAESLFELFRAQFAEIAPSSTMDVRAEPGVNGELEVGETITIALPLRGNVQVRVEEVTPRSATVVTLAGHPLAGAVRFLCEERGDLVRFEVQTYDRAANLFDLVAMSTLGRILKARTWTTLVQGVVAASGGAADKGVESESEALSGDEAKRVEAWVERLVLERKREAESPSAAGAAA